MGGVFNVVNLHLYHYAGNNPVKYVDPDGREQTDLQKWLTDRLSEISGSTTGKKFLQENISIVIQRSRFDNGANGMYFRSTLHVMFDGIALNSIPVQSTVDHPDYIADTSLGWTLDAGTYEGTLLARSGTYKNAIHLVGNNAKEEDFFLIHPNAYTVAGATTEYSTERPYSGGCQISHLSDFNEVRDILKSLGFKYSGVIHNNPDGDTIKVKILAPPSVPSVSPRGQKVLEAL